MPLVVRQRSVVLPTQKRSISMPASAEGRCAINSVPASVSQLSEIGAVGAQKLVTVPHNIVRQSSAPLATERWCGASSPQVSGPPLRKPQLSSRCLVSGQFASSGASSAPLGGFHSSIPKAGRGYPVPADFACTARLGPPPLCTAKPSSPLGDTQQQPLLSQACISRRQVPNERDNALTPTGSHVLPSTRVVTSAGVNAMSFTAEGVDCNCAIALPKGTKTAPNIRCLTPRSVVTTAWGGIADSIVPRCMPSSVSGQFTPRSAAGHERKSSRRHTTHTNVATASARNITGSATPIRATQQIRGMSEDSGDHLWSRQRHNVTGTSPATGSAINPLVGGCQPPGSLFKREEGSGSLSSAGRGRIGGLSCDGSLHVMKDVSRVIPFSSDQVSDGTAWSHAGADSVRRPVVPNTSQGKLFVPPVSILKTAVKSQVQERTPPQPLNTSGIALVGNSEGSEQSRPLVCPTPREVPLAVPAIASDTACAGQDCKMNDKDQRQQFVSECFKSFDRNQDGRLSLVDLGDCLRFMSQSLRIDDLTDLDIWRYLKRFDSDGDQRLSKGELQSLYQNLLLAKVNAEDPIALRREMFIGHCLGRPEDHYDIMEVLGRGNFGVVRRVVCKHSKGVRVMKTIDKRSAISDGCPLEQVTQEIERLRTLDHPTILRLLEYYVDDERFHLVTDMLCGGNLLEVLTDAHLRRSPPDEEWVRNLFVQVCEGINYTHGKGVMHRDLKLDNILLGSANPPEPVIIDVGFAELFPSAEADTFRSAHIAGTISTMAPEVINRHYTYKCDVWSLGCCLYALLCQRPTVFRSPDGSFEVYPYPFTPPEDRSPAEMEAHVQRQCSGPDWGNCRSGAVSQDLIGQMLTFAMEERPTMQTVLAHEWLRDLRGGRLALDPTQAELLRDFTRSNALEQAVLMDVATQIPISKVRELTALFESLDIDGTGTITFEALTDAMQDAGVSSDLARRTAQQFAHNGRVEFSKFVAALVPSRKSLLLGHLHDAFNRIDHDGDGFITAEEFENILTTADFPESVASHNLLCPLGGPSIAQRVSFNSLQSYFMNLAEAVPPAK